MLSQLNFIEITYFQNISKKSINGILICIVFNGIFTIKNKTCLNDNN